MKLDENDFAQAAELGIKPVIMGYVESELKNLADCPHWQDEGPAANIVILPKYAEALNSMVVGQPVTLVTWLHQSNRNVLISSKHGRPERGVFSSRSPVRPNPVGLHDVIVTAIDITTERAVIRVNNLEALNGTPVLDIKTRREHFLGDDSEQAFEQAIQELIAMCKKAGEKALMPGFSGNASAKVGEYCVITKSGAAKERLNSEDFVRVRIADGKVMSINAKPSSEIAVHLEIYKNQPAARVVLHTHPACLLALGLKKPQLTLQQRLDIPVFEATALCARVGTTARIEPGLATLGAEAGNAARKKQIIWLEGHGLCVWGTSYGEVMSLSEETEHLAKVALLAL